jgi:hypothetical protein
LEFKKPQLSELEKNCLVKCFKRRNMAVNAYIKTVVAKSDIN